MCWMWTGGTSGQNGRGANYPRMTLSGQTVAVHIVMYTNFFGYVPGKRQVDHKCRNRLCVNPSHLSLVSNKENARRRDGKRPHAKSDYDVTLPEKYLAEVIPLLPAKMKRNLMVSTALKPAA